MCIANTASRIMVCVVPLVLTPSLRAERPCPPDVDCNGDVGVDDLVMVVLAWGDTEGPADVDGSGLVEIGDLFEIVESWGTCLFDFGPDYENPEAEQIALEMLGPAGPLLVDPEQYERIDRDLALIREAIPDLADLIHTPDWEGDALIVHLEDGRHDDYECLNTYYQVVEERYPTYVILRLPSNVNTQPLATTYAGLPGVASASPSYFGVTHTDWIAMPAGGGVWHWTITHGFADCQAGCICSCTYIVDTDARGDVELVTFRETCPGAGCGPY